MKESELRGIFCARGGKDIYKVFLLRNLKDGKLLQNLGVKMKENINVSLLALEHTDVGYN